MDRVHTNSAVGVAIGNTLNVAGVEKVKGSADKVYR